MCNVCIHKHTHTGVLVVSHSLIAKHHSISCSAAASTSQYDAFRRRPPSSHSDRCFQAPTLYDRVGPGIHVHV